mgnify:CR=1 FL=1
MMREDMRCRKVRGCGVKAMCVDNSKRCGPNESFKECPNACQEGFCGDEVVRRFCTAACEPPACQCSDGFVRNPFASGKCVKREECPKRN